MQSTCMCLYQYTCTACQDVGSGRRQLFNSSWVERSRFTCRKVWVRSQPTHANPKGLNKFALLILLTWQRLVGSTSRYYDWVEYCLVVLTLWLYVFFNSSMCNVSSQYHTLRCYTDGNPKFTVALHVLCRCRAANIADPVDPCGCAYQCLPPNGRPGRKGTGLGK